MVNIVKLKDEKEIEIAKVLIQEYLNSLEGIDLSFQDITSLFKKAEIEKRGGNLP